jgi:hypothetical protein
MLSHTNGRAGSARTIAGRATVPRESIDRAGTVDDRRVRRGSGPYAPLAMERASTVGRAADIARGAYMPYTYHTCTACCMPYLPYGMYTYTPYTYIPYTYMPNTYMPYTYMPYTYMPYETCTAIKT